MSYIDILEDQDTSNDFGITLVGAMLLHIVLILGITFSTPRDQADDAPPQLEITLVHSHKAEEPEQADFLANASQDGGGNTDEAVRTQSPLPGESSTQQSEPMFRPPKVASSETVKPLDRTLEAQTEKTIPAVVPQQENREKQEIEQTQLIGLPQAINFEDERERLLAEISQQQQNYQKRPRRKFLTARTREYKYASYMDSWRAKVERIGNLNYPEEAKRRNLTGNLVLDVAINPDGKLDHINIIRSSGQKALDDAAIRIVRLAAPYAPFPKSFRDEVDILHITRTWKFEHGDKLVSQ